ncbi:glycosyltransferase family 2 protein [Paenibacillus piscarius]|uniref:glycosyltransferase family 2 protein n=1 Tax=Paenibacillus piscarius TaxID=1089681 RepID=UPI001EE7D944|nr:glycosyltransferase [Paenibacillus piscarius]
MKISIIIPTYNKPDYLTLTLKSFCLMDFDPNEFEVIVCNDGSECSYDSIGKISYPYSLRILMLQHKGRAAARNAAIQAARGEVIVFNDDDTLAAPEFLSGHWTRHLLCERVVVLGERRQVYGAGRTMHEMMHMASAELLSWTVQRSRQSLFTSQITRKIFQFPISRHWICSLTGNMSLKAATFSEIGGFDEAFAGWGLEDIELGYRLYQGGFFFYYDPDIINYHLEHLRNKSEMFRDTYKNMEYFLSKYGYPKDLEYFRKLYYGHMSLKEYDHCTFQEMDRETEDSYYPLFRINTSQRKDTI